MISKDPGVTVTDDLTTFGGYDTQYDIAVFNVQSVIEARYNINLPGVFGVDLASFCGIFYPLLVSHCTWTSCLHMMACLLYSTSSTLFIKLLQLNGFTLQSLNLVRFELGSLSRSYDCRGMLNHMSGVPL